MTRPDDCARMAQHFEDMHTRREAEARIPAIVSAVLLLGGFAIGLLLGVLLYHFISVAAAAVTDPLAGMPW